MNPNLEPTALQLCRCISWELRRENREAAKALLDSLAILTDTAQTPEINELYRAARVAVLEV